MRAGLKPGLDRVYYLLVNKTFLKKTYKKKL